MQKQAPSRGRLAVMAVFTLSCFAIVLFLWKSFGGPVPLGPQGYRFSANFGEATQLADNADVRISGVPVGRVITSKLAVDKTRVEIEIDAKYAPIPRNTQAILRQKTLLGETYVEITPGDRASGDLPDGAVLRDSQVKPTVELDEILRAFDPATRRDLKVLLAGLADSLEGRGEDLSDALGNAAPFAEDTGRLLRVLDTQDDAVRRVVRDSGVVFDALGRRQGELSGLVRNTDRILSTTARRNGELAEAVRILPTTLRELRPTLAEVESISREARPLVADLRPVGRALAPALRDTAVLAPQARRLFLDLDRVTSLSRKALPALTKVVREAHPLVRLLEPTLQEALPVADYLGLFKQETVTAFANLAAATQGQQVQVAGADPLHYLRALVPFTAEGLVAYDERIGSNRHNPYLKPRGLDDLPEGIRSFDCRNKDNAGPTQPAPPCREQGPYEFRGEVGAYPRLRRDPR